MNKFRHEIIAILVFMFCAFGLNVYRVQGDGEYYFAVTERILHIPDPESAPQFRELFFFSAGCAFFNAPFYMGAYGAEKALGKKLDFNGITLRSASINIASNFYMILAILLMFRILKRLNVKYALISVLCVLFSTSAFAVSTVMPSYNHAVDIFLTTLFVFLIIRYHKEESGKLFWLGALYPLMITVRYFNFIVIVPVMLWLVLNREFRKCLVIVSGTAATIWILPVIFIFYSHGTFLSGSNVESISKFPMLPVYGLKLLVHPIHGLFVWSPVTILSAIGLVKMTDGEKRNYGYLLAGFWAIFVFAYGYISDWHAGWSFSNRYLSSLFPVYTIGLAYFIQRYGKWAMACALAATAYSIFLFFNWYICVIHGQWGTPIDMIRAWVSGKSVYFSEGKVHARIFSRRVLNLFRYKHIAGLFR
ncbi:MAG: glycosyltransferase family 39 protein [Candidatus Omnitrophica bacterium]|nr:glycosyltransferase family 39 protein [Candidatus Omnitrophota bacterium]